MYANGPTVYKINREQTNRRWGEPVPDLVASGLQGHREIITKNGLWYPSRRTTRQSRPLSPEAAALPASGARFIGSLDNRVHGNDYGIDTYPDITGLDPGNDPS
jgi:hypothetical protein